MPALQPRKVSFCCTPYHNIVVWLLLPLVLAAMPFLCCLADLVFWGLHTAWPTDRQLLGESTPLLWPLIADGLFKMATACPAGGQPLVVSDPMSSTSQAFMNLGAAVVQEVAKLKLAPRNSVRSAFHLA